MNNKDEIRIRPVILSGGFGRRLWPISSKHYPKQFAKLINDDSMFSSTLRRVGDRNVFAAPIIVGNIEHIFFILSDLAKLGIEDATVLLEPDSRNTATAAIVAALHEQEPDMQHLVIPSDHYITERNEFRDAVLYASAIAEDRIVLFGIAPEYAETGYGYILPGKAIHNSDVHEISVFHEKPNETFARVLISQDALWNSGIFLYNPTMLCKEAEQLAPEHYAKCKQAIANAKQDEKCTTLQLNDYVEMENLSFDRLIMENTQRGAVLPCSIGWNDIGSWHSLWQIAEKDQSGNALIGPVVAEDMNNSYIHSEGVSVAAFGMDDCIIIANNENVLVAPRSKAQDIKRLFGNTLTNSFNTTVTRPWGTYKTLAEGKNYLIKQITIWPGCSISLQAHNYRAEHWVVVTGTAVAECNGETRNLLPNESIFVPHGAKHRLSNPGQTDVQIIEVQSGNYIGEDDIVRFEDLYGRS